VSKITTLSCAECVIGSGPVFLAAVLLSAGHL
jgi:hypothetical protein